MRIIWGALLAVGCGLTAVGCASKPFDGPTVDAFHGRLVHNGKPVSFPDAQKVELKLFHEKGESFGIPIKSDGTFEIGWMPVGTYSASLTREGTGPAKKGAAQNRYSIPSGLKIEDKKTQYEVELGKNFKP